jgi:lysophospholipase L1-like esterase
MLSAEGKRAVRERIVARSLLAVALLLMSSSSLMGQTSGEQTTPTLHPALFLVGDSTMQTGSGNGERGPWGWGSEISAFFDPLKIHIYNEGKGGRSSRGYVEEGLWLKILERLQPGDFVIIQFGHNDAANSQNYPDRTTIGGVGDETIQVGVGDKKKVIGTYGWYLRNYVVSAHAKGATVIICSPVPRRTWNNSKIVRGFDGYAGWAATVAKSTGALSIDLNKISADSFDKLGEQASQPYFNDFQHTTKLGAKLNAESVVTGIKNLKDRRLARTLLGEK